MVDLPWKRARSAKPQLDEWTEVLRFDPAPMYRYVLCDDPGGTLSVWRMESVVDKLDRVEYQGSQPGVPAYFSIPPCGALISVRRTVEPGAMYQDPWTDEQVNTPEDASVYSWESDGPYEPQELPPTNIITANFAGIAGVIFYSVNVSPGLYEIQAGQFRGNQDDCTIELRFNGLAGGIGSYSNENIAPAAGRLDIPPGSPIYTDNGLLTLRIAPIAVPLSVDLLLVLRKLRGSAVLKQFV